MSRLSVDTSAEWWDLVREDWDDILEVFIKTGFNMYEDVIQVTTGNEIIQTMEFLAFLESLKETEDYHIFYFFHKCLQMVDPFADKEALSGWRTMSYLYFTCHLVSPNQEERARLAQLNTLSPQTVKH